MEVKTEGDEEEFVPEEEEEGPSTQGDGLMAAKAKRQSGPMSPAPSPVKNASKSNK